MQVESVPENLKNINPDLYLKQKGSQPLKEVKKAFNSQDSFSSSDELENALKHCREIGSTQSLYQFIQDLNLVHKSDLI